MSAEILRKAAALMRERANAATPGPWTAGERCVWEGGLMNTSEVVTDSACGEGGAKRPEDAEYIASWHPAVALAVADLLDGLAPEAQFREKQQRQTNAMLRDGLEPYPVYYDNATFKALAVACAYLGEPS